MVDSGKPTLRKLRTAGGRAAVSDDAHLDPATGESLGARTVADESTAGDSPVDLEALLMRLPSEEETRAWAVLSPALRRRAVDRIALLRRWSGERDGLTAKDAAAMAGVIPNRFYQMAAAWKRAPGLSAVGAYAAAPVVRSPRIHPTVNAALQANVVRVVAEGGDGPVEAMRRRLEELVADDLRNVAASGKDLAGADLVIPSSKVVRAVITRELSRIGEAQMLGESIAMDCCPTTMRSHAGEPWACFVIIDRGTLRILGTSVGSLDDSVTGYSLAAKRALLLLVGGADRERPWAQRTRRVDLVVGRDTDACDALIGRYAPSRHAVEFKPVTRPRRFGSLLRRYVGERMGRVHFRPGWAVTAPPPMGAEDEVFERWDAAARADFEAQAWNEAHALDRAPAGESGPPAALLSILRLVGRGNNASARDVA